MIIVDICRPRGEKKKVTIYVSKHKSHTAKKEKNKNKNPHRLDHQLKKRGPGRTIMFNKDDWKLRRKEGGA